MELLEALQIIGICAALVLASAGWDWLRSLLPEKPQLHGRNDTRHLDEIRK